MPFLVDGFLILQTYAETHNHVDTVRREADEHKDELGWLSKSAFYDFASQNKLWVVVESVDRGYVGHLMFGGAYPNLRIYQIYIQNEYRRKGLAKKLLQALVGYGESKGFLSISARVADDLTTANQFWEYNDFLCRRQVRGGKTRNRILNIRSRDLNTPTLYDAIPRAELSLQEEQYVIRSPLHTERIFVIDLNVFFDLVKNRPRKENVSAIFSASHHHFIKVCVTPEFTKELRRNKVKYPQDPILDFASTLPTLPEISASQLAPIIDLLKKNLFPHVNYSTVQSESDVTHLAYCIQHDVHGFVTSDKEILRAKDRLFSAYNLEVVSPAELSSAQVGPSRRITFATEVDIVIAPHEESQKRDLTAFLRRLGVDQNTILSAIVPGTNDLPRKRIIFWNNQRIIGFCSWEHPTSLRSNYSVYALIDEDFPRCDLVIEHAFESISRDYLEANFSSVQICFHINQVRTRETALKLGYRQSSSSRIARQLNQYNKIMCGPVVLSHNWSKFNFHFHGATNFMPPEQIPTYGTVVNSGLNLKSQTSGGTYFNIFKLESFLSPTLFLFLGRTGLIIPIMKSYADQLFSMPTPQGRLLETREAPLLIEKAYYRKPSGLNKFSAGTPVVFYQSRTKSTDGMAVGCGRITFSKKLHVDEISLHISRQGVLDRRELLERANTKEEIHVFTFDNFKPFTKMIEHRKLKQLGCGRANFVGPEGLDHRTLSAICREGYRL
ncbi:MAG: GNAT family N-acetyltransferase [Elusimicrobia bacterium]|nr:GNAT family N-acetyltransferase [Elusimicrobiota bacterium]